MSAAILIIEDEIVLAKNMRTYLERNGYEVRCTESAEEGLAALEVFRPDVVLLDFNLPGIDGLQAMARIRAYDAAVRVIMVTGHGSVEIAVEAMKSGAVDFLTKPVALAKLRLLIERATRKRTRLLPQAGQPGERLQCPAGRIGGNAQDQGDDAAAAASRSAPARR